MQVENVKQLFLLTLLPVALLLTGCASRSGSTAYAQQPLTYPPVPQLSQPIPSQSYSSTAQADMLTWQQRVTGTSTTSKP